MCQQLILFIFVDSETRIVNESILPTKSASDVEEEEDTIIPPKFLALLHPIPPHNQGVQNLEGVSESIGGTGQKGVAGSGPGWPRRKEIPSITPQANGPFSFKISYI